MGLAADLGTTLVEGDAVGLEPDEGNEAGLEPQDLADDLAGAGADLVRGELVGRGGAAGNEVGDAEARGRSSASSKAEKRRGVNPAEKRVGQNRLPGPAKWWPTAAL